MLHCVADCHGEGEEDDLRDGEEANAEENVADGPSIVQGANDDDELGDHVGEDAYEGPNDVDDPETEGFGVVEPGESLECSDGDEEGDTKHGKAGDSETLRR